MMISSSYLWKITAAAGVASLCHIAGRSRVLDFGRYFLFENEVPEQPRLDTHRDYRIIRLAQENPRAAFALGLSFQVVAKSLGALTCGSLFSRYVGVKLASIYALGLWALEIKDLSKKGRPDQPPPTGGAYETGHWVVTAACLFFPSVSRAGGLPLWSARLGALSALGFLSWQQSTDVHRVFDISDREAFLLYKSEIEAEPSRWYQITQADRDYMKGVRLGWIEEGKRRRETELAEGVEGAGRMAANSYGPPAGGREAPLFQYLRNHNVEAVKALLDSPLVDLGIRDEKGNTPLHRAVYTGSVDLVRQLIDARADPNARGPCNLTPLHIAASMGHMKLVTFLLGHGADPLLRDEQNLTPAQCAARAQRVDVARFLVSEIRRKRAAAENGQRNSDTADEEL